ncbi:hypothetical protein KW807_02600 [Candidatus Parcubacteria bacterium]|nr:hypothetical protein [Candidatus Parcubacteria bacterium]
MTHKHHVYIAGALMAAVALVSIATGGPKAIAEDGSQCTDNATSEWGSCRKAADDWWNTVGKLEALYAWIGYTTWKSNCNINYGTAVTRCAAEGLGGDDNALYAD